jgi:hypothetical protein
VAIRRVWSGIFFDAGVSMRARIAVCFAMLVTGSLLPLGTLGIGLGTIETKLVGSGLGADPFFGSSVAVSADGTTAIVGAPGDNNNVGSAVVFIRNGNVWAQQGPKLTGTGPTGPSSFGKSVALSADGNTAIVGGPDDNSSVGAAWVFTRTGSAWSQQGNKLVGTGVAGSSQEQGAGVALSADGNTAIVGGPEDGLTHVGATWVFTRTGGNWSQQGNKLVGAALGGDTASLVRQGSSVAISADGNTALIGGPYLNAEAGAVWVFTRSGGAWTQQGPRLVGTGGSAARQGRNVALSADGNTAVAGGPLDNSLAGAAWVFTRTGSTWAQQGPKLVGTGAVGAAEQGAAVSVSADGNVALVAGRDDDSSAGAVWVFARSAGAWMQQGQKLVGSLALNNVARQGFAVALSGDGSLAISGGPEDNGGNTGAAWVFAAPPCSLDIDGNNAVDAMTDGLLIVRAMLGLTGTAVTDSALGANATRSNWAKIRSYLNANCGSNFAP